VYDKLRECRGDSEKIGLLWRRLGCEPQEGLTRVEFQVRRPVLKAQGICETHDIGWGLRKLMEWLTVDWCRVCRSVDRENGNQRRAAIHPLWDRVRAAVPCFGAAEGTRFVGKCPPPDIEGLARAALGCVARIWAMKGRNVRTPKEFDQAWALFGSWAGSRFDGLGVVRRKVAEVFAEGRERRVSEAA
jgi:hypothetical protein